jgi:excisionase family DNA binding protein
MSATTPARTLGWLQESELTVFTRQQVADALGVDPRTVTRAIEDGSLPSLRLGRRVLIPRLPLLAKLGIDPVAHVDIGAADRVPAP